MFMIFKLIFLMVGFFVLMTVITGLSLWMRIRQHLQNPFLREPGSNTRPTPPPGRGDIIEGDYQVLDDRKER